MKEWYFYDSNGTRRKVKQPYFYESNGTRRKVKAAYFYESNGTRRQFYQSYALQLQNFSMTTGSLVNNIGFSVGNYGSTNPVGPTCPGGTLRILRYNTVTGVVDLQYTVANPGSRPEWFKTIKVGALAALNEADATYTWNAAGFAEWSWDPGVIFANGVTYPVTFT